MVAVKRNKVPLITELGIDVNNLEEAPGSNYILGWDMQEDPDPIEEIIPKKYLGSDLDLPDVPEVVNIRHFHELSRRNYCVDMGIYPLGSCTMKYNPKINENIANLSNFKYIHPLQPNVDGSLAIIEELGKDLCEITGMDAFTLNPAAGAHGELTGILIIKKYFESRNIKGKNKIIVPDSAHGTNPASAAMSGFAIIELESNEDGEVPLDQLEFVMKQGDVAGIMLTNPNTLGLFDRNILKITEIVHRYGGLCYYDGANMNPMLGICRPGDMGFDIVHLNLHKTFSTPHGGGGPGAGPVGVKKELIPFLPVPKIVRRDIPKGSSDGSYRNVINSGDYRIIHSDPESIGRIHAFYGNFSILIRALAYIKGLGAEGLKRVGEISVLNANYLRTSLKEKYHIPYDRTCMHEFVIEAKLPNNVNAEDVSKRLLDYGIHAPTNYFPLIVHEALMIEPTETEPLEELDYFIGAMMEIYKDAEERPETLKKAPHNTPIGRLDAVMAARKPILHD